MDVASWVRGPLLGLDFETTGVDPFEDVPVSYALVTMEFGSVTARTAAVVDPRREIPVGATSVHGITTRVARKAGCPLAEALELVASTVLAAGAQGVPVVGMNLRYDLTILDVQCRRLFGRGLVERGWRGPALDALVLDRSMDRYRKGKRRLQDLCRTYGVTLSMAHDPLADTEAALRVLRSMVGRFPEIRMTDAQDLHDRQVAWHREWAESFDDFCRENGRAAMDPTEHVWPIANPIPRGVAA